MLKLQYNKTMWIVDIFTHNKITENIWYILEDTARPHWPELSRLEHHVKLELTSRSRPSPYMFMLKGHPSLKQRWLEHSSPSYGPAIYFQWKKTTDGLLPQHVKKRCGIMIICDLEALKFCFHVWNHTS